MGHRQPVNLCWHSARPGVEAWSSSWSGHAPPRHSHDAYQLSLTRAGRGSFVRRGDRIACRPGRMILIEPGEVHEVSPDGDAPWVFDTLYLDEQAIQTVVGSPDGPSTPTLPTGVDDRLVARFDRLHRAVVGGSPVIELEEHLVALVHGLEPGMTRSPGRLSHGAALDRVREYLDECAESGVSLAELAALAGLSPSHLSRSFRRAFGLPPHAYLIQARVLRARAMLGRGTPVVEVAARAGFADQAHLTRHFRRLVGVTPGAYRSGGRIVQDRTHPRHLSSDEPRAGRRPR